MNRNDQGKFVKKKKREYEELPDGNRILKWVIWAVFFFPWVILGHYLISTTLTPKFADALRGLLNDIDSRPHKRNRNREDFEERPNNFHNPQNQNQNQNVQSTGPSSVKAEDDDYYQPYGKNPYRN